MGFTLIKSSRQKGFTLIELIIVMVMLSALGMMTSSYIGIGVDIYSDITARDRSLGSVRFVMERLRREIGNALPNSAKVSDSADTTDGCLTFYPIIASSIYGHDFPIAPLTANAITISAINDYSFESGDLAAVYLLDAVQLTGDNHVQTISSITDNNTLNFASDISFDSESPAQRIYIVRDSIAYCFKNDNLYRTDSSASDVLMAEHLTGSFSVNSGTELDELFVRISYTLDFDGQEAKFEQSLQINNIP